MRRQSVRFADEPPSAPGGAGGALRGLAEDTSLLAVLAVPENRSRIIGALRDQDRARNGLLEPGIFRRALYALQVGLGPAQVESLLQAVLWLGKREQQQQQDSVDALRTESMVPYELLFNSDVGAGEAAAHAVAKLDESRVEEPDTGVRGSEDPPPPSPQLLHQPAPPSAPLPPGLQTRGQLEQKHEARQAVSRRFRMPSVESLSPMGTLLGTDSRSSLINGEEVLPNTVAPVGSSPAKSVTGHASGQRKRKMRLGSVEELLFDMPVTSDTGMRRATMPALELIETTGARTDIAMNLSAYSSIGVTSVFFASLSLSTIHALMGVVARCARGGHFPPQDSLISFCPVL